MPLEQIPIRYVPAIEGAETRGGSSEPGSTFEGLHCIFRYFQGLSAAHSEKWRCYQRERSRPGKTKLSTRQGTILKTETWNPQDRTVSGRMEDVLRSVLEPKSQNERPKPLLASVVKERAERLEAKYKEKLEPWNIDLKDLEADRSCVNRSGMRKKI